MATLRQLLSAKTDVNAAEPDGATALHWAVYRDNLEAAKALLKAGAEVNRANDLGATPLWLAAQNTSLAMVDLLLAAGANVNAALTSGETPLMVAARAGNAQVVDRLAAKGANLNATATRRQTALMWAVAQKHSEVVKVLIARGADLHARSESWSQRMAVTPHGRPENNMDVPHGADTALLFAARVGDLDSTKLLVDAGANVDDRDAWGVTSLVLAAHSGFRDIVEFLLDRKANPNLMDAGFSALHIAIMRRDERMAAALLAHGADANAPLRTWTPARRSSYDWFFAPALVGATPFWLAARFNQPTVMRMLVEKGADPKVVHRASYMENRELRKTHATNALLAAVGMGGGAAWVQPPSKEKEALMLESVKLAVELGCDIEAKNTDGKNALTAAKALKYESVVAYLTEKGAQAADR
jgi:ankyrin repeat protein